MKKTQRTSQRTRSRTARRDRSVVVVGLGYVGLPLALLAAKKGYEVVGVDVDVKKIKLLERRKAPFLDAQVAKPSTDVANDPWGKWFSISDPDGNKLAHCAVVGPRGFKKKINNQTRQSILARVRNLV